MDASRMVATGAVSTYAIGEPGRAVAEVSAGAPARRAWCPDIVADAADVPGLTVRAASCRGVLHRKYGTSRQDSYSMMWHQDSTAFFITVRDGVGSLEMSQDAAEWVTSRMAEIVRRDKSGTLDWPAAFATLSAELAELAAVRGPMATTVVSACVTPVDDRFRAEIAWVGDRRLPAQPSRVGGRRRQRENRRFRWRFAGDHDVGVAESRG